MDEEPPQRDLAGSSATFPTDSENYSSSHNELSPSPPSSSSSPMILYTPPTIWDLLRGAAINILLPFVNGLMLGFGELLAHEAAFRLGWSGTKVRRLSSHSDIARHYTVHIRHLSFLDVTSQSLLCQPYLLKIRIPADGKLFADIP
jgi:hypothetical protein